jgi:hypothetical protein
MNAVNFQWDYFAFPVWVGSPLPTDLEAILQAWSDEGTEHYSAQLYEGTSLPAGWEVEWSDRGRALARKVSHHLGRPVDYANQATRELENITD